MKPRLSLVPSPHFPAACQSPAPYRGRWRHCYQCDAPIPPGQGWRRWVPTGASVWSGSRGGVGVSESTGPRTLCGECAERIDTSTALLRGLFFGVAGVVAGALALAWIVGSTMDAPVKTADPVAVQFPADGGYHLGGDNTSGHTVVTFKERK